LHAVRNALRWVGIDDDLTMLVGAATEALPVPHERLMQMRHADEEIERAAARFEQLAEELDPASAKVATNDRLALNEPAQQP
jgi:hypothetical protein